MDQKEKTTDRKTYKTWFNMVKRCTNPNHNDFKDYGGRGITVCDRWRYSFDLFYKDMGERPDGYTIERIDNNKGYYPENCKYIPKCEQAKNTRAKGCSYHASSGKYMSRITRNGKEYYLGLFNTPEQANEKYWQVRNVFNECADMLEFLTVARIPE